MGNHLVVLDEVPGLRGDGGVGPHDVVGHDGPAAEEGEAPWRAQHAAHDVLGGLLQPVADGVLEHLSCVAINGAKKTAFYICGAERKVFFYLLLLLLLWGHISILL